jgi:hypothetical protein
VIGGGILLAVHAFIAINIGPGYAIPVSIIGAIGAAIVLRGPLGEAVARRIQGGSAPELPPEQVLNELDELRGRITELEERADFAERLLAKAREGEPQN